MRTLPSALLTAQKDLSREPYVPVVIENLIGAVRRLEFVQLYAGTEASGRHDVAVAGDGSVTRVRVEAGAVKQQRVTSPGAGPWSAWNALVASAGANVACAAKGARVAIAYTDAAGTGLKLRESLDNGATFGAEQAVATAVASVTDLALAYKSSAGDLAIAWTTSATLYLIKRTAGAFGAVKTWPHTVSSLSGVAMVYGFDFDIALTGVEATTLRPSMWTLVYGDGVDAALDAWSALLVQQQAESDAQVTFKAPFLTYADTYRLTYVEDAAYSGGAAKVFRTHVHPGLTFVSGAYTLRSPAPVNHQSAEGLALAGDASAGYLYETDFKTVWRAAKSAVTLDVTADVLALGLDETTDALHGYIELDNSDGRYAGPPSPIAHGNLAGVSWGYRTPSGQLASRGPDAWIAAYEYRRSGGVSVLRLTLEGGWSMLARTRERAEVVHASGADAYATILARICYRAGLQLTQQNASSRATGNKPSFTVHAQTSGMDALRQCMATLADRVRMTSGATAVLTEPKTTDAIAYTFGTDHAIDEVQLHAESPPYSGAQIFASATFAETYDYATAALYRGEREQLRDLNAATPLTAASTALARSRRRMFDAAAGELVVSPNCGEELLDVIAFTDTRMSASQLARRVKGIKWSFDRQKGLYRQTLVLGEL